MSGPRPILVINPNSTVEVTEEIAAAVNALPGAAGRFECVTIAESPRTISTDQDVTEAGARVADLAATRPDAAAIIIACFSDPGLTEVRHRVRVPVIGIQMASVMTAIATGAPFGVIALSPASIPRHMAFYDRLGILHHCAGEVGLSGVSALDAGRSDAVYAETLAAGKQLVAQGARSVIPGCAGFSPRRMQLETDLGVPVIDPVRAAAAMAPGLI
ncbi:aspartate/glutamate racemase family protein [Roseobacter ponti]|uniref:Asp/Glu/hydantoin racemase n=1 Tax=Roseobacter ponti TaxID=1891787 RepID=A0A858SX62_9RHOB|nr:aspartate/glutamate racemase family protein [Roseobacter ponti]QJF53364.1 Asp/Glu/hydantoin racemase [Roseobacter ponti]